MNNDSTPNGEFEKALDKALDKLLGQLTKLIEDKSEECPYCGKPLTDYPALSRADNKTEICPACGVREAMEAMAGIKPVKDKRCRAFKTRIVKTPGVDEFPHDFLMHCLERHANQDWGDMCKEDKKTNDDAVKHGGRVLSSYELRGDRLWIITEADRSVTTLMTPDEY
jgi:RNA polymerase subunit RPABC4/transcription elongation factor Spt4